MVRDAFARGMDTAGWAIEASPAKTMKNGEAQHTFSFSALPCSASHHLMTHFPFLLLWSSVSSASGREMVCLGRDGPGAEGVAACSMLSGREAP